jgi:uncharacterized protein (TIGR03083 family)
VRGVDRHEYLGAVDDNAVAIARAVQTAAGAPVPSCPDWRLRDLGYHLGCVLNLWADVVRRADGQRGPLGSGMQRPDDDDLERFVRDEATAFLDVLAVADEDTPAWTWWGDATARRIPRRVAHETTIHRWDATNALGAADRIPPTLAADGVVEFFDVTKVHTGHPPEGLAGRLILEATDLGRTWVVEVAPTARPSIAEAGAVEEARATVRGEAVDLLLLLWRRLRPEALEVSGDSGFVTRFLACPDLD